MAILGGTKFLARFQFQAIPPTLCTTVQKLCPASLFLPEGTKVDISPFRSIRSLILMVTVPPLLHSPRLHRQTLAFSVPIKLQKEGDTLGIGQGISDQLTGKTGKKIFNKLTNQDTFDQ